MITENFEPEWIRKLNEISKQLQNVTVKIPSLEEQKKAKGIIEQILPPEEGQVTMEYVRHVLIALAYAETHFRCSMLDDIKEDEKIDIQKYR